MRITRSTAGGCLVLQLSGRLDTASAAQVRSRLRKELLDSAHPVVCDLAGVSSFSRSALTVFPTVFAMVGGWPLVSLGLARPAPDLAQALHATGVTRRVPLVDLDRLVRMPGHSMWRPQVLTRSTGLVAEPTSAGEARREVADFCAAAGCRGDCFENAKLIVSELVSNAVRHGVPPIELRLLATEDAITISVSDGSPVPARIGQTRVENGRGLALVQALATAWSSEPVPGDGKTVWARVNRVGRSHQG